MKQISKNNKGIKIPAHAKEYHRDLLILLGKSKCALIASNESYFMMKINYPKYNYKNGFGFRPAYTVWGISSWGSTKVENDKAYFEWETRRKPNKSELKMIKEKYKLEIK